MPTAALIFLSMIKNFLRLIQSTIGLSRTEAKAFLAIIPFLFIVIFSEPLYRWFTNDKPHLSARGTVYLDSLVAVVETKTEDNKTERKPTTALFAFDPNTANLEELNSLGIPEKISKRVIQYRTKGGSFRVKSDLAKMYGMDSLVYKKLYSFILLPEKMEKTEFTKNKKSVTIIELDINLADTSAFKSVRGIGSVLAKRIIKYRDGLGGFVHLYQLNEVFGLDSSALKGLNKFFIAENFVPTKIIINKVTEKELEAHPYISAREAKSILTYRSQHGSYSSSDDLLKIKSLNENTVSKISAYLSFE